ncbi:hypothetical protein [Streptomyces sp. NPDC050564]|uniref:hypothetical protein n=1 Tax=Streptomyces sp. NPDC050564 TaxID=3365631 RepID=UPI0037A154D6
MEQRASVAVALCHGQVETGRRAQPVAQHGYSHGRSYGHSHSHVCGHGHIRRA